MSLTAPNVVSLAAARITAGGQPPALPATAPLKWRVLDALSRSTVGVTVQQVTDRLTPRQTRPFASVEEYRTWKRARVTTPKRVSSALRRLRHEGYVQPSGSPRLDPAERDLFLAGGWERFRRFTPVERDGFIVGEVLDETPGRERFRRRIVEALAQEPNGIPYRHLLEMTGGSTAKGGESKTWRRAFADLVDSGTVVPARAALPTLKGLQKLRSMR